MAEPEFGNFTHDLGSRSSSFSVESLRKVQSDTNSFLTDLIKSRGESNGAGAGDHAALADEDVEDDDNDDVDGEDDSVNKEPLEKIPKLA